ncbi:hypothetical protein [Brevibacterium luteolum]|uniref:hypothetical protein n=1 Tax=Brevibacterium luteolum TaxID=199591 RepID=UPI00223B0BAE|nr:hypothetical protein [Brevibacterium luteolum]MCT1656869.1 hypothetical protein [Brevibacterium luteolum]
MLAGSARCLPNALLVLGALTACVVVDTLGRYPAFIVAFMRLAVAWALYLPADSGWLLSIVRFAHGAVFGADHTGSPAIRFSPVQAQQLQELVAVLLMAERHG